MQVYHGMNYFLPQARTQHIECISLPEALCYHIWTISNPEIAWISLCSTRLYRVGILSKDLKLQLPQVYPSSHPAKSHFPETESWVCSGSGSKLLDALPSLLLTWNIRWDNFCGLRLNSKSQKRKNADLLFFKLMHIGELQTYLFLPSPFYHLSSFKLACNQTL